MPSVHVDLVPRLGFGRGGLGRGGRGGRGGLRRSFRPGGLDSRGLDTLDTLQQNAQAQGGAIHQHVAIALLTNWKSIWRHFKTWMVQIMMILL